MLAFVRPRLVMPKNALQPPSQTDHRAVDALDPTIQDMDVDHTGPHVVMAE